MERNNTTINVSIENRNKINNLKYKWKLKTHDEVLERLLKQIEKIKDGKTN